MSVFQVQLNNYQQGLLDLNPSTATPVSANNQSALGVQMQPSKQRTIFVAGPHRIYRELFDGATFTDCNYWKRFAYPQVPLNEAFISVVTDDGSVWSDFLPENTYPLVYGGASALTVLTTDTYATNYIDIAALGGFSLFTQISNLGTVANQDVKIELNGSTSAIFTLAHGDTQVFNSGDMAINKIGFQGGVADSTVQVILSVKTVPTS